MTPEIKDQLTSFLVAMLAAIGDLGALESLLLREARLKVNPAITAPDVALTLRELADKALVISFVPAFGAHRWRATAVGRSVAQEQGLA